MALLQLLEADSLKKKKVIKSVMVARSFVWTLEIEGFFLPMPAEAQ